MDSMIDSIKHKAHITAVFKTWQHFDVRVNSYLMIDCAAITVSAVTRLQLNVA